MASFQKMFWLLCCFPLTFGFQSEMPHGPFMGLEPTDQPQMLFPDLISTAMGEYNGVFSPSGNAFYYTASLPGYDVIVVMRLLADGAWSKPEIAAFSGNYPDFDALFSPDGNRLFFSSRRPLKDGVKGGKSGIWVMEKRGDQWEKPKAIVLAEGHVYYSSLTNDGKIYFNTRNQENKSQDIFCASPTPDGFKVEVLGQAVNSGGLDVDPYVSPDERFLLFRSSRPGGLGGSDLYISYRMNGQWQKAVNLGAPINSPANESCPFVTLDENLLIFASSRFNQSFYEAKHAGLDEILKKYQGPDNGRLNIYVVRPSFLKKSRH